MNMHAAYNVNRGKLQGPKRSIPQSIRLTNKQINFTSGGYRFGSGWLINAPSQPNFSAALRDANPNLTIGFPPSLTHDVPVRKVVLGDRDLGLSLLSWFQCHTREAIECLRRLSG